MTPKEIQQFKTDIALIKKDIHQIEATVNRISTMAAQIAVQEKTMEYVQIRLARMEEQSALRSSMNEDFRREFNERHDQFRSDFNNRFDDFVASFEKRKNEEHNQILEHIRELTKELRDKDKDQDAQINDINKWKWYAIGGVVTLSSIISLTWKTFFS